MKFAKGRIQSDAGPQTPAAAGTASAELQQSPLLQQQTAQLTAIRHSVQQQLQRKQLGNVVSQKMSLDEEEPLQGKFEPAADSQCQAESSSNNTGMPDQLKSGIESLSGYAMDDVKVHYNSAKPATMQAHAYAQGSDIHIAPGQEQHLPHEAWHVVQQKQGRVKATTQLKGEAINDDPSLEYEADVMGARALQLRSFDRSPKRNTAADNVVQCLVVQSDWLRKTNEQMETATSSGGPWSACEDKTNAGYRDAAEQVLGSLDGINTLAKHKIIPPATMSGRGPLAKAHLIAAEFGGQLKYSPSENIRYHPLSIEYGQWQLDENQVGKSIGRGYITSRSTELGRGASTLMSLDIGKIIEKDHGYAAGFDVSKKIATVLGAAASVPTSVSFQYNNIDNPELNFNHSWDGLESVLKVQSVPAESVFSAMIELQLELPSNILFDSVSNDVVIKSKEKLVELIDELGIKGGSLKNLVKKINQLKDLVKSKTISVNTAIDALNKHPYLKTKPGRWVLADSFDSWEDLL
jgi:hypothetical protein